jgi:drug/metabolite transporter (DMT)-like permease
VSQSLLTSRRAWWPSFIALAIIWGSSFLFIKVGIGELPPVYVALGRSGSGALVLLLLVGALRHRLPSGWRVWAHLTFAAVMGVVIPFTLFGYAEQRVPSILAGIFNATTPLFALPLAVYAYRTESMTVRRAAGLGLGFVGVLTILGVWHGVGGASLTGQLMGLGAALCYGISIPYTRRYLAHEKVSGISLAAGQLVTATGILAVVSPLIAGAPPAPTSLSLGVIASVLALGAFGTGVAFALNFRVIRLAGATTSASVTYLVPILSTVEGVLLLGERLNWYQPVGALVVLLAVAISQGAFPRRRRVIAETAEGPSIVTASRPAPVDASA